MSKLIYAANISLDGFLEDATGSFDWSTRRCTRSGTSTSATSARRSTGDACTRRCGCGRTMTDEPPWSVSTPRSGVTPTRSVYSSSLTDASTTRTRIERQIDPEAVGRLEETSDADLSIGRRGDRG